MQAPNAGMHIYFQQEWAFVQRINQDIGENLHILKGDIWRYFLLSLF